MPNPPWWILAQILVWILQRVDLPPQDAEQFCKLNPKIIEGALDALTKALFNALYVKGMPMTIARVLCGHRYKDLAAVFSLPPSLEPGAVDALKDDFREFIRQQPDIQFNPTWGRWTWPVCVSAAQAAPIPTRPSEPAVAAEAKPLPGSKVGSGEPPSKPDASTPANVGYVDPDVANAIDHFAKQARARSARTADKIIAEIEKSLSDAKSLSDSLARSGEIEAPGSDPAARAEESMPKPASASEPTPPVEPPRVEPGRDIDAADTPVQGTQVKPGGPQLLAMGGPESSQMSQAQQPLPQQWDPRAEWSVEMVFQELRIKGPVQEVIVKALPKIYGDDIAGVLDRLVAKTPWPTAELRRAIGNLLEKEAGKTLRDKEIPSWDACKDFLVAWHQWRAHHPFKI
jgi:hypothetical protein